MAIGAFLIWGFIPAYFKLLEHAGAATILAHRTLWSALLLAGLVVATGGVGRLRAMLADWTRVRVVPLTAANWLLFVVCVLTDRVVQASLAYFLTPLVMAGLGFLALGERPRRTQVVAIATAGAGVVLLVVAAGELPWFSLLIAGTWSAYGLVRRKHQVPAIEGLTAELWLLAPIAGIWLLATTALPAESPNAWPADLALLAAGAIVTATPLLLFGGAANRIRLATLGLMQYFAPTIQLLLGVLVYGEPFGPGRAIAFAVIWTGIAIYSADALRHARRSRRTAIAARTPPWNTASSAEAA